MLQVGLFRKSGVKSRIQTLRDQVESEPEQVSFSGQSAFDVADLVKQYFRDLPEPVFSSRLCETFLHIYQCKLAILTNSGLGLLLGLVALGATVKPRTKPGQQYKN